MHRHALLIASALALAGCSRAPSPASAPEFPPEAAPVAGPAMPATESSPAATTMPADQAAEPQQPAPMPDGSMASYQCDDGTQVDVHFNGIAATVVWPDGRTVQLSQAENAVEGQPQVYSDRQVRIERAKDGLHLRDGTAAETLCTETSSTA